jgi:hypothetical protein
LSDALAWRSLFEIVKSIETPVGPRRRDQGAVTNGDLRSTALGVCRVKAPDEPALPDEPGTVVCGCFAVISAAQSTRLASRSRRSTSGERI